MIRINLLPGTRRETRGAGGGNTQFWLAAYFFAAVGLMVVLLFVYLGLTRTLNEELAQNRSIQQEIAELQEHSASIEEVRAELEESRALEEVVTELQRARYGPTTVLMELSRNLSVGGGPTIDEDELEQLRRRNPQAGFDPGWDTRRLWLTSLEEVDRRATLRGVGKTNEDVAEFLRRLTLSRYFERIELIKTEGEEDRESGIVLIAFELTAELVY
ncbi:MAG: PilN domain-containing protein [Sandaracinaceae bacterium]